MFYWKKIIDGFVSQFKIQLLESGHINSKTQIQLGLIAGNVYKNQSEEIAIMFREKGWFFWGPSEVKDRLKKLAEMKYENNPYVLTAKILLK